MINVSAHINLPRMFLSGDYIYEKKNRIGQATSDLLYMRFIYYKKDNQHGCSRRSNWLEEPLASCIMVHFQV